MHEEQRKETCRKERLKFTSLFVNLFTARAAWKYTRWVKKTIEKRKQE